MWGSISAATIPSGLCRAAPRVAARTVPELVEELLQRRDLEHAGLEPDAVRRLWAEHLTEKRRRQYQLWNALMFRGVGRTTTAWRREPDIRAREPQASWR